MRSCRISPVRKRGRELLGGVLFQPLDEPHHVNDHSLVGAGANGRDTLCRFDLELNAATIDLGRSLRKGLIALRAAFSMAMIMTGVANTGGIVPGDLLRRKNCAQRTVHGASCQGCGLLPGRERAAHKLTTGNRRLRRHDAPARKSRIVIDDKRATCNACGRRSQTG